MPVGEESQLDFTGNADSGAIGGAKMITFAREDISP